MVIDITLPADNFPDRSFCYPVGQRKRSNRLANGKTIAQFVGLTIGKLSPAITFAGFRGVHRKYNRRQRQARRSGFGPIWK